jgi:hypothetical protein
MTTDKFNLPVSMLSPTVDPGRLGFEDTSELESRNEIGRTHHYRVLGDC